MRCSRVKEANSDEPGLLIFLENKDLAQITGSKDTVAIKKRTPRNVTGPTCSIPFRWATNAVPHMNAVSVSKNIPRIWRFTGLTKRLHSDSASCALTGAPNGSFRRVPL
jgi:hypothetical protein